MGATLPQLVRGLTGAVTREDAKKIARLHGFTWKSVLKAMKRRARHPLTLRERYSPDVVESLGHGASKLLEEIRGS